MRRAALFLLLAGCGGGFGPAGSDSVATGPGPWPVANVSYGPGDGIQETPVVGLSTDAAQNRWLATNAALYWAKSSSGITAGPLAPATGPTPTGTRASSIACA